MQSETLTEFWKKCENCRSFYIWVLTCLNCAVQGLLTAVPLAEAYQILAAKWASFFEVDEDSLDVPGVDVGTTSVGRVFTSVTKVRNDGKGFKSMRDLCLSFWREKPPGGGGVD